MKAFEPGLLAAAHRGLLYVDEVNLLHDHLVDLLLDAAAMGTAYVEREGVSVRHAARFLLVGHDEPGGGRAAARSCSTGSGWPSTCGPRASPSERAEVVRRRLAYDADPDAFAGRYAAADSALARTDRGRPRRCCPTSCSATPRCARSPRFARLSTSTGCAADLVTARTAIALAAWDGRTEVTARRRAHRRPARTAAPAPPADDPFDAPGSSGIDEETLERRYAPDAGADPDEPPPDDDPGGGRPESRATIPQTPATQAESGTRPAATARASDRPSRPVRPIARKLLSAPDRRA